MADSEISRTLPLDIKRKLLSKVVARSSIGLTERTAALLLDVPIKESGSDPALSLWRQWYTANRNAERLGRKQARLETQLFSMIGGPSVKLRIPGEEKPVVVRTEKEIDRWFGDAEASEARVIAIAELSARLAAWRAADEQIGFSCAKQAEEVALDGDDDLAGRLWETPAQSIAGAIGKLHALLKKGQPSNHHEEFPWPQIRSVLEDLAKIEGGWMGRT